MNLAKTTFYTSVSTAVTFLCGFIVAKVVAVKIGPSGIAMVGQFQNSTTILTMLGTGAVNMGVVKYLSENRDHPERQQQVISNAVLITLTSSFLISALVMLGSVKLSEFAFHSGDFWLVYLLFGAFLTFLSLNAIFAAVFNGLKEIKKLTIVNLVFSLVGIVFTVLFAELWSVKGVLVAASATAFFVFCVNLYFFRSIPFFRFWPRFSERNPGIIRRLLGFSLMSSISTLVLPGVQFFVRNKIITDFSVQDAGYWQGVTKISDYYLAFITTVLSVYYLPRLSEITRRDELRAEISKGYKLILPAVGILAVGIWLFRHYIILVLFSNEFLPMKPLFTYQLIGDFVKIASWLLGFLMWARAMTKTFIITEVIFGVLFVILSTLLINQFGVIGATYAFAINYVIYFFVIFFVMKRHVL